MQKPLCLNLPKTVFTHNVIFLFFFFITPKIYFFEDFGSRGEDIIFPLTFLLFLAVLPKLKELEFPKLHSAIIAYFAYVIIQGLILSPLTGAFKYFAVITMKQLQYFMVFYLLLYTFKFTELKEITMKFISILVGTNLVWALFQIVTGRQVLYRVSSHVILTSYGIGTIGENHPHQAAAIFLFCFLFAFIYKKMYFRKPLILLAVLAVLMTISRATIFALVICVLYILVSGLKTKGIIKKPALIISLTIILVFSAYLSDKILSSMELRQYNQLKARISSAALSRGSGVRFGVWDMYLKSDHYAPYKHLNYFTGMGRGFANIFFDQWTLMADSGYLRDFMEIGIIGLFLQLFIFFRVGQYAGLRNYSIVLLPYLFLFVIYEVFLVSKSGIIIFILSAVFLSDKLNMRGIYK